MEVAGEETLPVTVPVLVLWGSRVKVFPLPSQCLIILKYNLYFLIEKEKQKIQIYFWLSWQVMTPGGFWTQVGCRFNFEVPALTHH